jgi:hypothetical protein
LLGVQAEAAGMLQAEAALVDIETLFPVKLLAAAQALNLKLQFQ